MSVSLFTTTSSFLVCTPAISTSSATTTFTETYTLTLPAACPTSEWMATYTVTEVCTGVPALWTTPSCPPNFYTTTVTCDACQHPTQVITCPNAAATGVPQVIGVEGNGVTITLSEYTPLPTQTAGAGAGVPAGAAQTAGAACSTCVANGGSGAAPANTASAAAAGPNGAANTAAGAAVNTITVGAAGAPQVTGFASVTAVGTSPAVATTTPAYVQAASASSMSLKGGLVALAGLIAGAAIML